MLTLLKFCVKRFGPEIKILKLIAISLFHLKIKSCEYINTFIEITNYLVPTLDAHYNQKHPMEYFKLLSFNLEQCNAGVDDIHAKQTEEFGAQLVWDRIIYSDMFCKEFKGTMNCY